MADKLEQSLGVFLNSAMGQELIDSDIVSLTDFDEMKRVGYGIHNLRSSLAAYEGAMRDLGFGNATVHEDKGTFTIAFAPTSSDLRNQLDPKDYPSLVIERSDDGFILKNGGGVGINTALVLGNGSGEVGVVSALSTSIANAAKNISDYTDNWKRKLNSNNISIKELARRVSSTTSQSVRSVQSLDPKYYSKTQIKDYLEDLKRVQGFDSSTAAGLSMIKNQVRMDLYWKQLYQKAFGQGKLHGDAPQNETKFGRDLETILQKSRSFTDFGAFTDWVKSNYKWVYQSIWDSDLANLYKQTIGQTTVMGVREGKPGVVGLVDRKKLQEIGEIDIPNVKFTRPGGGSRKIRQGTLGMQHNALYGQTTKKGAPKSIASQGLSKLYTNWQRSNTGFRDQDLYYAAELTDDVLFEIYKQDKDKRAKLQASGKWTSAQEAEFRKEAREILSKGFGDSATFETTSMNRDFQGDARTLSSVKGTVDIRTIDDKIRDKIRARVEKEHQKESISPTDLDKIVDEQFSKMHIALQGEQTGKKAPADLNGDLYRFYKQQVAREMGKMLNLTSMEGIDSFKLSDDDQLEDIMKYKKRSIKQHTTRGDERFDDRSATSVISDSLAGRAVVLQLMKAGYSEADAFQMVYQDGDPSKNLKVGILRESEDITPKNLSTKLNGIWEYIINEAERKGMAREAIEKAIESTNLKGVVKLDKTTRQWDFSNTTVNSKYFHAEHNEAKGQFTPIDYLNDLAGLGENLGILGYRAGMFHEEGGKVKSAQPFLTAQVRHVSSSDTYEGGGDETHSGSKWGNNYVNTLEGSIGLMRDEGASEDQLAPLVKHLQIVKDALAKKEKEYSSYAINGEYIAQTFKKDVTGFAAEMAKDQKVIKLSIDQIMQLEASAGMEYVSDAFGGGIELPEDSVARSLDATRDYVWGTKSKEEWAKIGVAHKNDLQFAVDLGQTISGMADGGPLATSMIPLYLSSAGEAKDGGLFMPDQFANSNTKIIRLIQQWAQSGAPDKESAAQALITALREAQLTNLEDIGKGTTYDRFHTVSKKEGGISDSIAAGSGYLLTTAMNAHASEIYKDLLSGIDTGGSPLAVINRKTAKKMYQAQWGQKKEEILKQYEEATGKSGAGLKRNQIINGILDAYTIDAMHKGSDGSLVEGYTGKVNKRFNFLRNPIIKFGDDIVNPGVVFTNSSKLVGQGAMAIDMSLAKSIKNDMDGDRILAQLSLENGDVEAWAYYTARLAQRQHDAKNASDAIKGKSTKSTFNAEVTDEQARRELESNLFIGQAGAGIYGDTSFGIQGLLRKLGLDQGGIASASDKRIANFATNIAGAMYQEGINIKNTKAGTDNGDITNDIQSLFYQTKDKYTWDNTEGALNYIRTAQRLGIFGNPNDLDPEKRAPLFKENVIGNMGLASLDMAKDGDKSFVEQLSKIADEALTYYKTTRGDDSVEYKNIQKDIDTIKEIQSGSRHDFASMSGELLAVLMTGNAGFGGIFSRASSGSLTPGQAMSNLYEYNEAKGTLELKGLNSLRRAAESGDFDQATLDSNQHLKDLVNKSFKSGYSNGGIEKINDAVLSRGESGKLITTSPSRRTKEKIISDYLGINVDAKEYLDDIRTLMDPTSDAAAQERATLHLSQAYGTDKVKGSLEAISRGSIAHEVAEKVRNGEFTPEQLLGADAETVRGMLPSIDEATNQLRLILGYGDEDTANFVKKAIKQGTTNADYVNGRIAYKGGTAIGNEVALAGFTKPKNGKTILSREYADLIYETMGADGTRTWTIGDYKNTKGEPTLANALQVFEYARSLQQLNEDIRASRAKGVRNFDSYLHSGSTVAEGWNERLIAAAKDDIRDQHLAEDSDEYKLAFNKAYRNRAQLFGSQLYDRMGDEKLRFLAELYTDSGNGVKSTYSVDLANAVLRNLAEKYSTVDDYGSIASIITSEDTTMFKGSGALTNINSQFTGTESEFMDLYSTEFTQLQKIVDDIVKKRDLIKKLIALKEAEEMKMAPDLEKIRGYDQQISDIEGKLGDGLPTNDVIGYVRDLEAKLKDATSADEIAALTQQIKEIKETDQFKLASTRVALESKTNLTSVSGKTIGTVSGDLLDVLTDPASLEKNGTEQGTLDAESIKLNAAADEYVPGIKLLRKLERQLNDQENLSTSKYLSKEQKSDVARQVEELQEQRDYVAAQLNTIASTLRNADGTWKREGDAVRYGAYSLSVGKDGTFGLSKKELSDIAASSKRQFEISEQQKGLNFFNKAYGVYKQQAGFDNQIWSLQQKLDNPKGLSEQEIKIIQAEIANLTQQRDLGAKMSPDIKKMEGWSADAEKQAQEKAQLEAEQWRLAQMAKSEKGSGSGSYGGFLGIDSTVMRWVDRMISGNLLQMGIRKITKSLTDLINKAKQLDSAMTNLRIVTGETSSGAKEMIDNYSELAKQLGVTTTEVTSAATEWLRQGYNVAEVNDLVQSSLYLSKLGMIDSTTATKDLTSAMKGFKMEASEAMDIVDKLTSLDVEAATTAGDIAEGLAEFANLATSSGVDIDQASAYVATIADVTQQSGSSVGTALKTILSRYGNVKATAYNNLNLDSSTADASDDSLNDVEKVLNKMGISMRDTNLEFKDFDEVLDEIADKWTTLDNVSKKAIANAFAGKQA